MAHESKIYIRKQIIRVPFALVGSSPRKSQKTIRRSENSTGFQSSATLDADGPNCVSAEQRAVLPRFSGTAFQISCLSLMTIDNYSNLSQALHG